MADIKQLEAKVAELAQTVDATQQRVANAIAALIDQQQQLEQVLQNTAGPEQLQKIYDKISAVIADLKTTLPEHD